MQLQGAKFGDLEDIAADDWGISEDQLKEAYDVVDMKAFVVDLIVARAKQVRAQDSVRKDEESGIHDQDEEEEERPSTSEEWLRWLERTLQPEGPEPEPEPEPQR